jgi:argininosuccinate synthase
MYEVGQVIPVQQGNITRTARIDYVEKNSVDIHAVMLDNYGYGKHLWTTASAIDGDWDYVSTRQWSMRYYAPSA